MPDYSTIERSIDRARRVVIRYRNLHADANELSDDEIFQDLVTDLQHYAESKGMIWDDIVTMAGINVAEEKEMEDDAMYCSVCRQEREDLDENDVCPDCGGKVDDE